MPYVGRNDTTLVLAVILTHIVLLCCLVRSKIEHMQHTINIVYMWVNIGLWLCWVEAELGLHKWYLFKFYFVWYLNTLFVIIIIHIIIINWLSRKTWLFLRNFLLYFVTNLQCRVNLVVSMIKSDADLCQIWPC